MMTYFLNWSIVYCCRFCILYTKTLYLGLRYCTMNSIPNSRGTCYMTDGICLCSYWCPWRDKGKKYIDNVKSFWKLVYLTWFGFVWNSWKDRKTRHVLWWVANNPRKWWMDVQWWEINNLCCLHSAMDWKDEVLEES